MVFMKEDKPLEVVYYLQQFYFLYPSGSGRFDYMLLIKHLSMVLTFLSVNLLGILSFTFLSSIDDFGNQVFENVLNLIMFAVFVIFSCLYITNGERIKDLSERISRITNQMPKDLVIDYIRTNKNTWITYIGSIFLMIFFSLFNYLFKINDNNKMKEDKRCSSGFINPVCFPFQVEDTGMRKIILIILYDIPQMITTPIMMVNLYMIMCIPTFLVVRMRLLRREMTETDYKNVADFRRKLKYYILCYSEISGCIRDMNYGLGYCTSSIYTMVSIVMALSGYLSIKSFNGANYGLFIVVTAFEFLLCSAGQSFDDEHEKLVGCVYSIPWYEMNVKMQSNYMLLLKMVQHPIYMRIWPTGVLNYKGLLSVYRTTYTILTFLINLSM